MPANASSFGTRSCKIWNRRSEPPRALGRIRRDMFDTEMRQRMPNQGRLAAMHLATGFSCLKVMTAAIGVNGSAAGRAGRTPPGLPGTSRGCLFPRSATPNKSRFATSSIGTARLSGVPSASHACREASVTPLACLPPARRVAMMQHHTRQRTTWPLAPVRTATLGCRQQIARGNAPAVKP